MRRRTQAEIDQLVAAAGFRKIEQRIDEWGIFTVSLAEPGVGVSHASASFFAGVCGRGRGLGRPRVRCRGGHGLKLPGSANWVRFVIRVWQRLLLAAATLPF